jgi:hypothetical protein
MFYEHIGKKPIEIRRWYVATTVVVAVPLMLITLFSYSAFRYYYLFDDSIYKTLSSDLPWTDAGAARPGFYTDLYKSDMGRPLGLIPNGQQLLAWFVLTFLFAEAAFVWLALKEYLQDVLGLEDTTLNSTP